MMGNQRGLASMVYKFFDKESKGSRIINNKENIQLADNFINQLLENFFKKYILHLEIIFGMLI